MYFGECVAVSFGECVRYSCSCVTAATFQGAGTSGESVTVTFGVSVTAVASRAQKPAARSSSGAAITASAAVSQVPAAWVLWVPYLRAHTHTADRREKQSTAVLAHVR